MNTCNIYSNNTLNEALTSLGALTCADMQPTVLPMPAELVVAMTNLVLGLPGIDSYSSSSQTHQGVTCSFSVVSCCMCAVCVVSDVC